MTSKELVSALDGIRAKYDGLMKEAVVKQARIDTLREELARLCGPPGDDCHGRPERQVASAMRKEMTVAFAEYRDEHGFSEVFR